jgi:hypothetical protein
MTCGILLPVWELLGSARFWFLVLQVCDMCPMFLESKFGEGAIET